MNDDDLSVRLELERGKIKTEQNKKDIDELGNTLRTRITLVETEVDKLNTTSTKMYAYIAALATMLAAVAWLIDHKGMIP
jgi:hypothetical protein